MNTFDLWLSLLVVLVCFQYSTGLSCAVTDEQEVPVGISVCPSLCSGPNCSSNLRRQIQAFTEEIQTPHYECSANSVVPSNDSNKSYTERHIIYVKNKKYQNIYLTFVEDSIAPMLHTTSSAGLERHYRFVLVSQVPVNWILSGNHGDARYSFYKNHAVSTFQNLAEFGTIDFDYPAGLSSQQVKSICCGRAFNVAGGDCELTSYLEVEEANFIETKVGLSTYSEDQRKQCQMNKSGKLAEDQKISVNSDVHVRSLKNFKFSSACSSGETFFSNPDVFAVELSDNDRDAVIKLRFPDAFRLKSGDDKIILLLASGNITWQLLGIPGEEIDTRLTIVVPDGNTVDTSGLVFNNIIEGLGKETKPEISLSGKINLDEILQIYEGQVVSYASFVGTPDYIQISFLSDGARPTHGPTNNDLSGYLRLVELVGGGLKCSSNTMRAAVTCQTLKEHKLNPSHLVFGNGNCTYKRTDDMFHWELGSNCGIVEEDDSNQMHIDLKVGDEEASTLKCRKPNPIKLSVFKDLEREHKVRFPQTVSIGNQVFYVQVNYTDFDKQNSLSVHLEKCVLVSRTTSTRCVHCSLVHNNCPVDESTSFLRPFGADHTQQVFLFSVQQILEDNVTGLYDLSCTVSSCMSKHTFPNMYGLYAPSLPTCTHENGAECEASHRDKEMPSERDSLKLTAGPFHFSPLQPDVPVKPMAKMDSRLIIVIMTVIGFVIGVLFMVSLCCIRNYFNRKSPTTNSSLYNQVNSYVGSTEDNYTELQQPLAGNSQQTNFVVGCRYNRDAQENGNTTNDSKTFSQEAILDTLEKTSETNPSWQRLQQTDNGSTDSGYPPQGHQSTSSSSSSSSSSNVSLLSSRDAATA